jgi:hypothetical protein
MPRQAVPKGAIEAGPQKLDAARFQPETRRRLSAPGFRTFLAIADLWGLNEDERRAILGFPSRSTFHSWAKSVREHRDITLDVDVLTRISALLGIHQGLGVLFESEREGIAWLRQPHQAPIFGGKRPLSFVTAGDIDALLTVRRFLDAARGGQYMPPNEIDVGFQGYSAEDIVFA